MCATMFGATLIGFGLFAAVAAGITIGAVPVAVAGAAIASGALYGAIRDDLEKRTAYQFSSARAEFLRSVDSLQDEGLENLGKRLALTADKIFASGQLAQLQTSTLEGANQRHSLSLQDWGHKLIEKRANKMQWSDDERTKLQQDFQCGTIPSIAELKTTFRDELNTFRVALEDKVYMHVFESFDITCQSSRVSKPKLEMP